MNLSVAIITHNEERIIRKTLESIHNIADEVVIVDSYSTDKTEEVCKQFSKVKFVRRKFDGFGTQKNYTINLCSGKWILFIDADEIIDNRLQQSISEIIKDDHPDFKVYNLALHNVVLGKIIKHGGWGKIFRERLFMNGVAKYSNDIVHEFLITNEEKGVLKGKVFHYTYKDIKHHIGKTNDYTTLMAKKMFDNGKKSSFLKIYLKPKFDFFKTFILRLGFLDGFVGYYIAKTGAFYTFLKYTKLYELSKNK